MFRLTLKKGKGRKKLPAGRDKSLTQPLVDSIRTGDVEAVKYLVDKGAAVNHTATGCYPPLFEAIQCKQNAICQVLVDNGADVDKTIKWKHHTGKCTCYPLLLAAQNNNIDCVEILLHSGCKITQLYDDPICKDQNILHYVARNSQWTVLDLLFKVGKASTLQMLVNERDSYGMTPMDVAWESADGQIISVFFSNGGIGSMSMRKWIIENDMMTLLMMKKGKNGIGGNGEDEVDQGNKETIGQYASEKDQHEEDNHHEESEEEEEEKEEEVSVGGDNGGDDDDIDDSGGGGDSLCEGFENSISGGDENIQGRDDEDEADANDDIKNDMQDGNDAAEAPKDDNDFMAEGDQPMGEEDLDEFSRGHRDSSFIGSGYNDNKFIDSRGLGRDCIGAGHMEVEVWGGGGSESAGGMGGEGENWDNNGGGWDNNAGDQNATENAEEGGGGW